MKIFTALVFIFTINILLFWSQTAVASIASDADAPNVQLYNYENSLLANFSGGNYTLSTNLTNVLPSGEGQIDQDNGNFFTDTFNTIKNWFLDNTGLRYLYGIVFAFPNFLKGIGLPIEISYGLGVLWHAVTIFIIIAWIKGSQ